MLVIWSQRTGSGREGSAAALMGDLSDHFGLDDAAPRQGTDGGGGGGTFLQVHTALGKYSRGQRPVDSGEPPRWDRLVTHRLVPKKKEWVNRFVQKPTVSGSPPMLSFGPPKMDEKELTSTIERCTSTTLICLQVVRNPVTPRVLPGPLASTSASRCCGCVRGSPPTAPPPPPRRPVAPSTERGGEGGRGGGCESHRTRGGGEEVATEATTWHFAPVEKWFTQLVVEGCERKQKEPPVLVFQQAPSFHCRSKRQNLFCLQLPRGGGGAGCEWRHRHRPHRSPPGPSPSWMP